MPRTEEPDPSFERMLAAARIGGRDAREELFSRFYPRVERQVHAALARDVRVGRPWLSTRFSTGDVVGEVFRSALKDLARFEGSSEGEFASYLTTLVRNRLLDIVRYHEADRRDGRRTKAREDNDETSPHDGPATDAVTSEHRELYEIVLATFEEREQRLLRGRIEQNLEFKDLMQRLGFGSLSATRRAFYGAQAQFVIRFRQRLADETR
ncbi:MAG: sigma-70 family RNA polymerase sigma factor [bacterium]|nr:sigma-70 family RNA polymerase sigma factor [bacterium]